MFVAVYQRALSLMYVDELLDCVLAKFTGDGRYVPQKFNYSAFNDDFRQLLLQCENRAAERSRVNLTAPPIP